MKRIQFNILIPAPMGVLVRAAAQLDGLSLNRMGEKLITEALQARWGADFDNAMQEASDNV
jgi:hypothetical protein